MNDGLKSVKCFSKLGKKISRQNLVIYRWNKRKQKSDLIPLSPALEKLKFLYNIKALKVDRKEDNDDTNIFSVEEKEKEKMEEFKEDIGKKKNKQQKEENNKINKYSYKSPKYYYVKKKHNDNYYKDMKKKIQPSCTKYDPKYDAILKRSPSSPSFKSMIGRKDFIKKDNSLFYLKPDLIQDNMAGKTFIDFSKQTKRNLAFLDNGDKSLINYSIMNRSLINSAKSKKNKSQSNSKIKFHILNRNIKDDNNKINKSKLIYDSNNTSDSNISNDSYDLYKHIYTKKLKKKNALKSKEEKSSKTIKTIDFDQIISREDLDALNNKEISMVPYLFPNFNQVRDRPIMMVVYDRKEPKKDKRNSENLSFYSYNLNKTPRQIPSPNFDLMYSRPFDENEPIPSHMKGVFNKNACFYISQESLKSNNYGNRGFIMPKSSFWKNSFNKFINLRMLKSYGHLSKSFLNDKNVNIRTKRLLKIYLRNYNDLIKGEEVYSEIQDSIAKSLHKHENKNLEQLIKEYKN